MEEEGGPNKSCPLCGVQYLDWALHIDEALGSCSEIDRLPYDQYFGSGTSSIVLVVCRSTWADA